MGIDGYTVLRNVNYLWDEMRRRGSQHEAGGDGDPDARQQGRSRAHARYWRSRGVTFYLNPLNDRAGNIWTRRRSRSCCRSERMRNREPAQTLNMSGCPALYSLHGHSVERRSDHVLHGLAAGARAGQRARAPLYDLWHGDPYQRLRAVERRGPAARSCRSAANAAKTASASTPTRCAICVAQQSDGDAANGSDRQSCRCSKRSARTTTPI